MATPYQTLFSTPGAKGFALAGFIARLPLPMAGIGIITLLSQWRGSYTLAGAVAATFVLTYALVSPQISRLADRYGQRHILPAATLASCSGFLLLAAASWRQSSDWPLFLGAGLAGFMPSISAMVRARWTHLYRHQPLLQTAYSLETVLDELTFIAGPPLSVGLAIAALPQAGLLAAAALLLAGVTALLAQRRTEPPVLNQSGASPQARPMIFLPHMGWLVLLMVAMGVIVGTVDIVSVAFAEQRNRPAAASLVLSAYASGSCLAGLAFGALQLSAPLPRLLLLGGLATAASSLPLLLAGNITALAGAVLAAGLFFSPTMIVAMSLAERLAPPHRLTEGMSWLLAGLNIGVALGAAVSGRVIDGSRAGTGFLVSLAAGAAVLLLTLYGYRRLRQTAAFFPAA